MGKVDPCGRKYYPIAGTRVALKRDADSDDEAVRQGLVSITPVSLYLTHYPALVRLRRWMELSQRSVQDFDGASGRESHSLQHVERS